MIVNNISTILYLWEIISIMLFFLFFKKFVIAYYMKNFFNLSQLFHATGGFGTRMD